MTGPACSTEDRSSDNGKVRDVAATCRPRVTPPCPADATTRSPTGSPITYRRGFPTGRSRGVRTCKQDRSQDLHSMALARRGQNPDFGHPRGFAFPAELKVAMQKSWKSNGLPSTLSLMMLITRQNQRVPSCSSVMQPTKSREHGQSFLPASLLSALLVGAGISRARLLLKDGFNAIRISEQWPLVRRSPPTSTDFRPRFAVLNCCTDAAAGRVPGAQ